MPNPKRVALALVPVLAVGWYLFRPELLFVNSKVDEKLSGQIERLSTGNFASYAHETSGKAELVRNNGKLVLSLRGFTTSNGPDVRVLLVKGTDPSGAAIKDGNYLDLGRIKGNIGDQNYELPAQASPNEYGTVTIWCKRFSVGFGGATLTPIKTATNGLQFAGYSEIRVTSGKLTGPYGQAELIENGGNRFLRIANSRAKTPLQVWLLKLESARPAAIAKATKVDLGTLKPGAAPQSFPVAKEIDAWLYRSVALTQGGKVVATADLRSDQERKPNLQIS